MEFIKKNYEKVVLGVVLLGLTVVACLLPLVVADKRAKLEEKRVQQKPNVRPLTNLDMSLEDAAFQRSQAHEQFDFTNKHNLFNPVLWKKLPDGRLLKAQTGNEEGVGALEVTGIKPLYLEVSYGSPSANGYFINIDRQTAMREDRRHTQNFVSKENKSELLALQEIKGAVEKPTELDLIWNETGEPMVITPEKSFKRVEGYSADLKYPLEANKVWTDRRVGARLSFANGAYKIVAITESNVVVSADSNNKKTTIPLHAAH